MKTEKRYPSFAVLPVADRNVGDWAAVSLLWKPSLDRTSSRNIKYGPQNEKMKEKQQQFDRCTYISCYARARILQKF